MNTIDADGHIVEKDADIRKHLPNHTLNAPVRCCRPTAWTRVWAVWSAAWRTVDIPTRLKDMDKEGIDRFRAVSDQQLCRQ